MSDTFPPFAAVEDVEAVAGELSAADELKVETLLDQASNQLRMIARKRRTDLDILINGDPLAANLVRDAVVNAVKRVLMNPDGWRQLSRTKGPFTESGTIDTALSSGMIYIADSDIDGLFPDAPGRFRSFHLRAGLL